MGDHLPKEELNSLCREAEVRLRVPARHFHKDYWVTQVLRALTAEMPGLLLFKGGTSLSKAYGLIQRFSEDVDLLVLAAPGDPDAVDAVLDQIRDCAARELDPAGVVSTTAVSTSAETTANVESQTLLRPNFALGSGWGLARWSEGGCIARA